MKSVRSLCVAIGSVLSLACVAPALADGTANILPSSAQPLGFSLSTLAQDTAVYNTGISAGSPSTPAPPAIPFTVLEGDTLVTPDTFLYLPVFFADDSGGAVPASPTGPAFPSDVTNQAAAAAYLDALVLNSFSVSQFLVTVDGQTQDLDDSYITGVVTPPLLDGTPAGTNYMSIAAVISPLSIGAHTVGFGGIINGSPVIFGSDAVTVTPEPSGLGLAICGLSVALILRRRTIAV
jgi:hypothetical protein